MSGPSVARGLPRLRDVIPPAEARLGVALLGSLIVNLTGQSVNAGLADIQGAAGLSAGEGSWLATAYTAGLLIGISVATPLVGAFGTRRCFSVAALLFAIAGAGCAAALVPVPMIALRAVQGAAAGLFSPIAFVATFMTMRGPRLALGLSLLAFTLLLPTFWAPVAAAWIEDRLGWRALFDLQVGAGAILAAAGVLALPRAPVDWAALRRDWTAIAFLAVASGATMLVLGQGRRLEWLDSPLILWGTATAIAAWTGLFVTLALSPAPVLNTGLVLSRAFLVPIGLNLLFRIGIASSTFLVPQFLIMTQGHRPIELAQLLLWPAIAQLLAFPLASALVRRIDGRFVAAAGLAICGAATLHLVGQTALSSSEQFRIALAATGAGQMLFVIPNLIAGGRVITPPDGPTATLMFNGTTVGGATLGVALAGEILMVRGRLHSSRLSEGAAAFGPVADKVDPLAQDVLPVVDQQLGAANLVQARLDLQSAALSFNDAFLLWGALLLVALPAVLLLGRQPPLGRLQPPENSR